MHDEGLRAVAAAQEAGQWDSAYQSTKSRDVPEDFSRAMNESGKAKEFFDTLGSQNRFSFVFRVVTAKKPETRAKRIAEYIRMMENGEVFHPKTRQKEN